jgi:hypothetical protein
LPSHILSLYLPIVDLFLEDLFLEGWGKGGGVVPLPPKRELNLLDIPLIHMEPWAFLQAP